MAYAVDLGLAPRGLNFDCTALVSGAQEVANGTGTRVQTMPNQVSPLLVMFKAAAFAAAGLPAPAPGWTLADLEDACAALRAAIEAGRLQSAGV